MALETASDPVQAWQQAKATAKQFRIQVPGINARLAAGGITVEQVVDVYRVTLNAQTQINAMALVSGLDAYVQTSPGKGAYVATAEIAAVSAAMQTALNWMNTNAAGLNLIGDSMANAMTTGSVATNRFGAGATSQLRTHLSAIEAAISA